jgi:hypothetical protein
MPELISEELIASEAYQHGRTQGKLTYARQALKDILAITRGKVRYARVSILAESGLKASADTEGGEHA